MRVALMQPYLFPYLGYFQLVASVDQFVFYDDVQYLKGGWVNRNQFLFGGEKTLFSFPVKKASTYDLISQRTYSELFPVARVQFLKTIEENYASAANFRDGYGLLQSCLETDDLRVAHLNGRSIQLISEYVGLQTKFLYSSDLHIADVRGPEKVIQTARQLGATEYLNASGGKDLYRAENFDQVGIKLRFVNPVLKSYPQSVDEFLPGLSVVDVILQNKKENLCSLFSEGEIT